MISEERLRELVQRILRELEAEEQRKEQEKKIYMLCTGTWDERYYTYLKLMEDRQDYAVYPVIPLSFKKQGYEDRLLSCSSCRKILYRSCERPGDLGTAVTVFPVTPRDVVVKTALCISDTFETSWITSCMECGGQVAFLRTGLLRFTGKEPEAYVNKILSYYRQVLSYGIEICEPSEMVNPVEDRKKSSVSAAVSVNSIDTANAVNTINENRNKNRKKRVITASNVSEFSTNGILHMHEGDVITDLAKDRAKFLNIKIE